MGGVDKNNNTTVSSRCRCGAQGAMDEVVQRFEFGNLESYEPALSKRIELGATHLAIVCIYLVMVMAAVGARVVHNSLIYFYHFT